MQDRDAIAEARGEARQRLRSHRDLGNEDDHPAAASKRLLGGGEIDLGLARAGDAVQEKLLAGPVQGGDDPLGGSALSRVELDRAGERADRRRHRPAPDLAVRKLD